MQPNATLPAESTSNPTPTANMNPADWLTLAREAFDGSSLYFDSSIRRDLEQDMRQFQSQHPAGSKYLSDAYRGRSKFFRSKTRAAIRRGEATAAEALFTNNDVVNIEPQDDQDKIQQASAEINKELLQYRLTKTIPWYLIASASYQEAQANGAVVSYQCWEYDEKKKKDRPAIKLVPLENLRIDPASDWYDPINSSPYIIEMMPMYVKDVRAKAKSDGKTNAQPWKPVSDAQILTATRGYSDSTRLTREGPRRQDSKDQARAVTAFTIVWIHKNIIEVDGIDWLFYSLGTTEMLSDPVPLETQYLHGKRPYVMGFMQVEAHRLYPSGVPRLTREAQAELNENANQRSDNVKFSMNKRYFVKRGKRVDLRSLIRNVPSSVTLMDDPETDVKVQETQDVTGSAYMEQDRLNLDFDDVAGTFSQSSVQSNRNLNETVGGMNLISAGANKIENYQLRTWIESWVEPVLRQLVLLEQEYESDATILALCARKAGLYQKFGINAVTDELLVQEFTLNVNVGLSVTDPTVQVNRFMLGLKTLRDILEGGIFDQYGLAIDEVIKEIFGKLGYKDGRRFFKLGEGEDPMVARLQAMVEQLQADLERKQPQALTDAMVKKVLAEVDNIKATRVKNGVEAAYSAMQGAGVIAATPQVAPIADTIMAAAGYTIPTPAGVDPNFGMEGGQMLPGAPLTQAAPAQPIAPPPASTPNTSPAMPPRPTAGQGETGGIETQEIEGAMA